MLVACGAAAAALVAVDVRLRNVAVAIAVIAAPIVVLGDVWHEDRVVELRESPAALAAIALGGGALLAALGIVFTRFPAAFAVSAILLLPLRVPIEVAGETANLLVPLYVVIASGGLASVIRSRRTSGSALARSSGSVLDGWSRWVTRLLAATLVLYALQAAYTEDVSNAIENAGFFLVPFAVMFALLIEVRWTSRLLGWALIAVGAVAASVALIGIAQYAARDLFLNPELFDANQLHQYCRVNSVFFDPNIFGRYLALAVVALAAYVAWGTRPVLLALAAIGAALALAGLALSFSITSCAAALTGLGVLAVLRWRWTGVAAVAGVAVAGLAALLIAGGAPSSDIQADRGIDSGREDLVAGGLELAGDRPLAGWGSGAFGAAFYERIEPARSTVSHSEPITVGAEQGAVGLVVYAALLVTSLVALLGGGAGVSAGRAAVGACFVAVLVHSLGYAGFAIDPVTWALLAVGLALRRDPPAGSATIQA